MAGGSVKEVAAETVIFQEGDEGQLMYVLLDGAVEIRKRSGGTMKSIEVIERPSDFFGEMALIDGKPRSASAVAIKPSRLMEVDRPTFENMLLTNGSFALQIVRSLSKRLRISRESPEPGGTAGTPGPHKGEKDIHSGSDPRKDRVRRAIAAAAAKAPEDPEGRCRLPLPRLRQWMETSLSLESALVDSVLEEDTAGGQLSIQDHSGYPRGVLIVPETYRRQYQTKP
jgi:hypothetical protein